jgi:hypothetical protein
MHKNPLRVIVGFFIGGFAGLSLATAVVPLVLGSVFDFYSVDMMLAVSSYGVPIAILMAIGGGILGWYGGAKEGVAIFGGCGAIAGFVLGWFAFGGDAATTLVSTLTGFVYGGVGGILIGKAFVKSVNEPG